MQTETVKQIANKLLLENPTLFRNDNGVGWHGQQVIVVTNGQVPVARGNKILVHPQRFTYGLCPGSSDYIGWESVIVTPEMVGKPIAVFKCIEVKTEHDRLSPQQRKWNRAVRLAGGISRVWHGRGEDIEVLEGEAIE